MENYCFSKGNLKKLFALSVLNKTFMDTCRQRRVRCPLLSAHFIRHRKCFTLISQTQVSSFQKSFCDECSKKWKVCVKWICTSCFQRERFLRMWGKKLVSFSCHFSLVLSVVRAKPCAMYEPWRCNCHPCLGEDMKGSVKASLMSVPPWTPRSRRSCVGLSFVFLNDILVLNVKSASGLMF